MKSMEPYQFRYKINKDLVPIDKHCIIFRTEHS